MTVAAFEYKGWTLDDAVDALAAYDGGAVDSGVSDALMKTAVEDYLTDLPPKESMLWVARHVRDHFLSEEALTQGYGIEDAMGRIRWICNLCGWDDFSL